MSNNLSKLLVLPAGVDLLVERAFRGHELLEGPLLDDVPRIQVDDVVGSLQVAEVVRDADRRRVLGQLVERLLSGFLFLLSRSRRPRTGRDGELNRVSWARKTDRYRAEPRSAARQTALAKQKASVV